MKFDEITIRDLFGHEAAEDESIDSLKRYYLKNKTYERFAVDLSLRILVGHKGTGKSALFKIAIQEDIERGYLPIELQPNDILDLNVDSDNFIKLIKEWEARLTEIIANKVFESLGIENKNTWETLKTKSGRFLNYLDSTIKSFSDSIKVDLNPTKMLLLSNFLKNKKIVVYIDDLDRGWHGSKQDITRISTLLNAVRDIINDNQGIYFRIALRSDVYYLVRTSDESTDKIGSSVIWYTWDNHEILLMLVKRIETFFGRTIKDELLKEMTSKDSAKFLDQIMSEKFLGTGKWEKAPMYRILMSLIRKRPRDLVKLCTQAARKAYDDNSPKILTKHFQDVFDNYSQDRVQDTINEYRTELPDIERLILNMKPNKTERRNSNGWIYTTDKLQLKMTNILQSGRFLSAANKELSTKQLCNFLYKINFLTARKESESGQVIRKYFEENRYISGEHADFGYSFEVHPAYRWALQTEQIEDIYKQIDLSAD
ncbi:P-loop ATPase, Sll1717 family [Cohnella sp. GCM10020058]|uniref:P-loop ATPase, Sll1717 family n=1 Tax=Cohnella sp. GCM10020058 TaxID=3317330 RepID=UPI00362F0E9D